MKVYGKRHLSEIAQLRLDRDRMDTVGLVRAIVNSSIDNFVGHDVSYFLVENDSTIDVVIRKTGHRNATRGLNECLQSENRFNLETDWWADENSNDVISIKKESIRYEN